MRGVCVSCSCQWSIILPDCRAAALVAAPQTPSLHLHSKALNKMFAYNHKQSEWRELAAMKTPRSMFGAVVHNGKIVVAGGVNEEGLTASCEAYDFATNKYDCVHV